MPPRCVSLSSLRPGDGIRQTLNQSPTLKQPVKRKSVKTVEEAAPLVENKVVEHQAREAFYVQDYTYADMWRETKRDLLFPWRYWIYNFFIPGMGFFTEGYILFSNGNLKSLYKKTWPQCWKTYQVCNANWVHTVSFCCC